MYSLHLAMCSLNSQDRFVKQIYRNPDQLLAQPRKLARHLCLDLFMCLAGNHIKRVARDIAFAVLSLCPSRRQDVVRAQQGHYLPATDKMWCVRSRRQT